MDISYACKVLSKGVQDSVQNVLMLHDSIFNQLPQTHPGNCCYQYLCAFRVSDFSSFFFSHGFVDCVPLFRFLLVQATFLV